MSEQGRDGAMVVELKDPADATLPVEAEVAGFKVSCLRRNLDAEDDYVDPNFFDDDYSIAGVTGHVVWDGTWVFIDHLKNDQELVNNLKGRRVVELGSGIGLMGLCTAAIGESFRTGTRIFHPVPP